MKTLLYQILLVTGIGFMIITSCEKNNDPSGITGKITVHSDCKQFKYMVFDQDTPDTLSCVTFFYDPLTKKLNLKHINAGFNCCPGDLSCEVSLNNDTIVIRELEEKQDCDCDCLFDLEIEIEKVEMQTYQAKFIEPYAWGQEPLIFQMDLASVTEGSYCVTRKQYPWGV